MKKINKITLLILLIFSIGFFGTFVSDYLISINAFGDVVCNINKKHQHAFSWYSSDEIHTDWGARHYWYNWGVFLLFFTSLIRIGVVIEE